MDSSNWMSLLTGFIGVVVGGTIPLVGSLLAKRAERLNELSKLIAEKRLAAYEEVITTVRFASIAAGSLEGKQFTKIPVILCYPERFDTWMIEFVAISRRVSHLIDADLSYELWVFQNYLHFLCEHLDKCRDAEGKISNTKTVGAIGEIVYKDFLQLTSRIIEQASKFFSTQIYRSRFEPSTIQKLEGPSVLPRYFAQLALISKKEEILRLINDN